MRSPREAERRLCRPEDELTGRQSSVRYSGAAPTMQCRTRRAILSWMRFPIGSQWSSLRMAAETLLYLGTPRIRLAAEFRTDWRSHSLAPLRSKLQGSIMWCHWSCRSSWWIPGLLHLVSSFWRPRGTDSQFLLRGGIPGVVGPWTGCWCLWRKVSVRCWNDEHPGMVPFCFCRIFLDWWYGVAWTLVAYLSSRLSFLIAMRWSVSTFHMEGGCRRSFHGSMPSRLGEEHAPEGNPVFQGGIDWRWNMPVIDDRCRCACLNSSCQLPVTAPDHV